MRLREKFVWLGCVLFFAWLMWNAFDLVRADAIARVLRRMP